MGKRLLVVEDDEMVREMICLVLEEAGYAVCDAENGFAALSVLGNNDNFSAVISDMHMPDITGLELMVEVHSILPDMNFIILTGENSEVIKALALSQGAKACLVKNENFDVEILNALKEIGC